MLKKNNYIITHDPAVPPNSGGYSGFILIHKGNYDMNKIDEYKLKQWYPSLPNEWKDEEVVIEKEDSICGERWTPTNVDEKSGHCIYENPECYPEFWEKVDEKNYEIVSFKLADSYAYIQNNGEYLCVDKPYTDKTGGSPLEWMVSEDSDWDIYSVKRLSDGEVFTIGDKINAGIDKCNSILSFRIDDSEQVIIDVKLGSYYLSDLEHIDTPIFTTEDGVDIYEGDKFWYIAKSSWNIGQLEAPENIIAYMAHGRFKFKHNAEDYVEEHKPRYSKADIRKAFRNSIFGDEYCELLILHLESL